MLQQTGISTLHEVNITSFKVKVILSKDYIYDITKLHTLVPKNTEWSGILVYDEVSGSIETKDLVVKVLGVHLCHIGDAASTEYLESEHFLAADERFYIIEDNLRKGITHTHHNMKTFFSSTDMNDLRNNIRHFKDGGYLLSIVNNYNNEFCGKVAIYGEYTAQEPIYSNVTEISTFRGYTNTINKQIITGYNQVQKEGIGYIECTFEYEQEDLVDDNIKTILDKYNEAKSKFVHTQFKPGTYNGKFDYQGWNTGWQDGFDDYDYKPQIIDTTKDKKRNKGIGKSNNKAKSLYPDAYYISSEILAVIKNPFLRVETWNILFIRLSDKNIESLLSDFSSIESVRTLEKLYVELHRFNVDKNAPYYPQYIKVLNHVNSLYE